MLLFVLRFSFFLTLKDTESYSITIILTYLTYLIKLKWGWLIWSPIVSRKTNWEFHGLNKINWSRMNPGNLLNYFYTNSNIGHVVHLRIIYRNKICPVDINFFNISCPFPLALWAGKKIYQHVINNPGNYLCIDLTILKSVFRCIRVINFITQFRDYN